MVEERKNSARRGWINIRNPQDFYGGLTLIALALVAIWELRALPGMKGVHCGPGTAPRLFAGLLAIFGSTVTVIGLLTKGSAGIRYTIRGPLLVTTSVFVFAGTIKPFGLVISTFVTVLVAATASAETRWRETVIWASILTVVCTLVFSYALNLTLPLWPRF